MRALLGRIMLLLVCGIATGSSASAQIPGANNCSGVWPEPFPGGKPFILNDPRSGLTLHVESDGRHMSATTRDGNTIWHRNLFSDPKLWRLFPPPLQFEGDPVASPKEEWRHAQSYIERLSIDRIGIEPDCMLSALDQYPRMRGHYILAGSGTHIFWRLDARTGDFQMDSVN